MSKLLTRKEYLEIGLNDSQITALFNNAKKAQEPVSRRVYKMGELSFLSLEDREEFISSLPPFFKTPTNAITSPQARMIRNTGYSRITKDGNYYFFKSDTFGEVSFQEITEGRTQTSTTMVKAPNIL